VARTETVVHARPEAVFAVLCDARAYQRFVVGTKRVRRFDARWPEPGAAIHHTVGVGPLGLRDKTEAVECEPPGHLVVHPHIRPFVVTRTSFHLEARGDDTLLRVDEHAIAGPLAPVWPGPLDGLMALRNRLLVRRLARLAEARQALRQVGDQVDEPKPV
jgi:hypothetical protein